MSLQTPKIISAHKGATFVFKNASCVMTMACEDIFDQDNTSNVVLGEQNNIDIVVQGGKVVALGKDAAKPFEQGNVAALDVINAQGLVLMPGLIDCHNHPIFAGSRGDETVLKSQGLSYEEIAARGGGISRSVKSTRAASNETLIKNFIRNAQTALARGVVVLEAKTGYGLNPSEELRLLECIYAGVEKTPLMPRIAPTLLGPHAASPDYHGLDNYIQALIDYMLNYLEIAKAAELRSNVLPLAVDVFIERNYFTPEQAERWLVAAIQYGLDVHIHADEFSRSGGAQLAIALAKRLEQTAARKRQKGRVLSVDHCQYSTETDLSQLQRMGVTPVVLPMTSLCSNIHYVEAKRLRAAGIRPAFGSDFNPGSAPVNNLWFAAYLALTKCGFSLPEVLTGITSRAAAALGIETSYGQIAAGRSANIIAFQGERPEDFFASFTGDHLELIVISKLSDGNLPQ